MVSRFKAFAIIIEQNDQLNAKKILDSDINNYLLKNEAMEFYAFILHDKDNHKDENGCVQVKRNHYHIVIKLKESYSKNTLIKDISEKLLINKNIISVSGCKSFVKSVQYLIHKNDKDKYQYDITDIWCNDYNELMYIMMESKSIYDIDIDYLIDLVQHNHSLCSIYKQLGLSVVMRYRSLIKDLWKDYWNL